jgi:uncharacterized Fe-S center protein
MYYNINVKNMNTSKVFFTDFHTEPRLNIFKKMRQLIQTAGIQEIDFNKKFTAVKIHFGEPGNMAYLRPNYAFHVVKEIKKMGGKPFLTDTNTLYSGRRANALDHLDAAYENGYSPFSTGCHVIIADGVNGMDYREIAIDGGEYCKTAKIGTAIADADIIITLNHFKGHEQTGFGGALKNLGMGSASVMGKKELHSSSVPVVETENCTGCAVCVKSCRHEAITLNAQKKATINTSLCVGCGQCIAVCQYNAAQVDWDSSPDELNCRIAEYTQAVLKDKPHFHINFIMDVSPMCDCWGFNDVPIVPDIGIAASFDPVALDYACADLVNKAPVAENCCLPNHRHSDKFKTLFPLTNWKSCLTHAEKMGIGKTKYELITV